MSTSTLERCVALDALGVGISDQAQQSGEASLGLVHSEWCLADGGRGSEVAGGMGSTKREKVMVGKGLQHGLSWDWEESRGHVMQGWAMGSLCSALPMRLCLGTLAAAWKPGLKGSRYGWPKPVMRLLHKSRWEMGLLVLQCGWWNWRMNYRPYLKPITLVHWGTFIVGTCFILCSFL